MLYNLLVDDEDAEGDESDTEESDDMTHNHGYKQMMLILQSHCVETGKSFFSEILARIYHGKKQGINSLLSFEGAKVLLSKGEPVIIGMLSKIFLLYSNGQFFSDDYSNDNVGSILLTRGSKSIWSKSKMSIRNQSTVPCSNILLCTNEKIRDLKVEGRNKDEIYMKFSVVDLGESPMSSSNPETKTEMRNMVIGQAKILRKSLPSFYGMMLQQFGTYITSEQFKAFEDITKHERLGNILKNAQNLHRMLSDYCNVKSIRKPKSLENDLETTCLTNKSVLAYTYRSPDQVVEYLLKAGIFVAETSHDDREGIVFDASCMKKFSWFKDTFRTTKDGIRIFQKMRTRLIEKQVHWASWAVFLGFDHLKPATLSKIKSEMSNNNVDVLRDEVLNSGDEDEFDAKIFVEKNFKKEFTYFERQRTEICDAVENYIMSAVLPKVPFKRGMEFKCSFCNFIARSGAGLKNHLRSCKNKR